MSERLRRVAAKRLAEDLSSLNGAEFETVGHMLVSAVEGRPLLHLGLTPNAQPAGYTVDTFDGGRTVVAEYSTEKGYFSAPYDKIRKDAAHACTQVADLRHLYLLSSEDCPNSAWEDAVHAAKQACGGRSAEVVLYGVRQVAESIYDQVLAKTTLYEGFSEFLPALEVVWRDHEFAYNRPQPPADYVADRQREQDLVNAVGSYPIVVIHGISGIGKSYLLRVAVQRLGPFENVVWLSGDDLNASSSLTSVTVSRLGSAFNLAGQFNNTRTLLVIDGWELCVERSRLGELEPGLAQGNRVVVSSQLAPSTDVHAVPMTHTDPVCAKAILTWGLVASAEDSRAADTIVARTGGHPLLMAAIRGLVKSGDATFPQVAVDAENWPAYEDPDTRTTILDRLLQSHAGAVRAELGAAKWLGTKVLDGELATRVLGRISVSKLRRRCLICDHSFGMLRFHDTVFLCLMKWPDNADQRALENSFLGFFAERIDVADYHFQRALHTCSAKVAELRRARPLGPDLAHYLYLLLDLPEKDAQVVEALARESLGGHIANRTALECGFQARELCRRLGMAAEEAERLDQATVTQVASLAGTDMPDLTRHTLLHHQGKAYRRLGEEDSARNAFAMALKVFPAAPHTRLQLSRLTAGAEQAEHLRRILGDFEKDPGAVAITVALAAVEETARLKDIAAVMPTADFLGVAVDAICLAQGEGYGQPFVTLAAIARARWYDDSPRLARIASILSLPPPEALDPKTAFGVAEAMKNVAKALLDSGDEQKGHRWLALAEPYYAKVDVTRAFAATMVAEYWVLRREGQRALGSLQQAGDCRGNAFYHYRRAQALLLIDETAGALAEIALALENAEPKYRSAFLGCQADILSRAGDRAGVKRCLEEALTCCENSKFRDAIQGRISRLLPVEPGTVGSEAIPRGGGDLSSTP